MPLQCSLPAAGKRACTHVLLEDPQFYNTALALASRQRRAFPSWGLQPGMCVGVQSDLQAVLQMVTQVLASLLVDCFLISDSPLVDTT